MKMRHFIDSHKGVTGVVIVLMMAWFDQWHNPTAWLYLALHGLYGLLWVSKSRLFPDRSWERPAGLGYGLLIWGSLSLYWLAPLLLMARDVQAPGWYLALCAALYASGVFLHFTADMQKHIRLQLQPGLISESDAWANC
jgi:hypothetical protein